jgi:hypothetical protein
MDSVICSRRSTAVVGNYSGIDSFQEAAEEEVVVFLGNVAVVVGNYTAAVVDYWVVGEVEMVDKVPIVVVVMAVEVASVVKTVACLRLKGHPMVIVEEVAVEVAVDNVNEEHCIAVEGEETCSLIAVVETYKLVAVVEKCRLAAGAVVVVVMVLCNHEKLGFDKRESYLTIVGAKTLDLWVQSQNGGLRSLQEIPITFDVPQLCFAQTGRHCWRQRKQRNQDLCKILYPSLTLLVNLSRCCKPF